MAKRQEESTLSVVDDTFQNVTMARGIGLTRNQPGEMADFHSDAEEVDEEDPHVINIRRKLSSTIEDLEEIHSAGLQAKEDKSKVSLFKVMHMSSSKLYDRFIMLFDELNDASGSSNIQESDKALRTRTKTLFYAINVLASDLVSVAPPCESTSSKSHGYTRSKAKLPTIELVTFNGQRTQWQRFKDTFTSLVINDAELTQIDKFHYLTTSLKDSAKSVIAQVPLTSDNFSIAWQLLIDTYDNQRILATAYLDQLMNIKPLVFRPSIEQLIHIVNNLSECIAAFKNITIEDRTDFLLFYLCYRCLDKHTREAFELQQDSAKFPSSEDLIKFLRKRCTAGELAIGVSTPTSTHNISKPSFSKYSLQNRQKFFEKNKTSLMVSPTSSEPSKPATSRIHYTSKRRSSYTHRRSPNFSCPVCQGQHLVQRCPTFFNMSIEQRWKTLEKWNGCLNCLFPSHPTSKCSVRGRCKFCNSGGHHSLLHRSSLRQSSLTPGSSITNKELPTPAQTLSATTPDLAQVMLGTALCSILDTDGQPFTIRLAMDSGSQFSFLTCHVAEKLGLPVNPCNVEILGIGQTPFLGLKGKVQCTLVSQIELIHVSTNALVVDTITSDLPNVPLSKPYRKPYESYNLADPNFGESSKIDFLLGGDLFSEVLTGDIVSLKPGQPKLIGTIFGYVVMGRIVDIAEARQVQVLCATAKDTHAKKAALLEDLERLWELDEPPRVDLVDPSDVLCEEHFQQTHYRLPTGRYVVRLPFKDKKPKFPSTRWCAIKRLSSIEQKLVRDPTLCRLYNKFMQEYYDMGHMKPASQVGEYLIPHHGIVKMSNNEPKIRVVFDASSQTPIGSLNDFLHVGPKLQNNIVTILLNFRRHRIAFTVDLVKMYRQVMIHPLDRAYQHILWRSTPEEPVKEYELCTITYGQGPAPYLALRTVKQLLKDEGLNFPLASKSIEDDMYVDDLVTGTETLEEALELQRQVINIFAKGEFPLSKWFSNHEALLDTVKDQSWNDANLPRNIENPEDRIRVKILGLQWDPKKDVFRYEVAPPELIFTKRAILSAVSRIYDPLGLLSPLVICAKVLIQESWKLNMGWDEQLPSSLKEKWLAFVSQLKVLTRLSIPRWVCLSMGKQYDLLIFGDASEVAYCAAAYLRVSDGLNVFTNLLLSKAKLAPIKPVTIPRLELCAALLASNLLEQLFNFFSHLPAHVNIHLFTDSTVVLGWLLTPPHQLKTFVANRVTQILDVTSVHQWSHVRTDDNPSDLGSRGLNADNLIQSDLWFNGPKWAHLEPTSWPVKHISAFTSSLKDLPEKKGATVLVAVPEKDSDLLKIISDSSSYIKVTRIFAWILRFLNNLRQKPQDREQGYLTTTELRNGLLACCRVTQESEYNSCKPLTSTSSLKSLLSLAPFIDKDGALRVGGRISAANLSFSSIHPIILPSSSSLASLIIEHYHQLLMHPGPSLLLNVIRRKFWIVGARTKIRAYTRNCIRCKRWNARPCQPIMANLPQPRLEGSRAFLNVGIDIGGPFLIRDSLRRKAATSKTYLCLFVCLGSKAVHLEVVSSISTPAFLAALDHSCFAICKNI